MYPCNPNDPEILNGGLPSAATARPPPRCQAWLPSQSNRTTPPSMSSPRALHRSPSFRGNPLNHHHIHEIEREPTRFCCCCPPPTKAFSTGDWARGNLVVGAGAPRAFWNAIAQTSSGHRDRLGHRRYEADRRAGGGENLTRVSSFARFYFIRAGRRTERGECCSQKDTAANAQRLGALVRKKHSRLPALLFFAF